MKLATYDIIDSVYRVVSDDDFKGKKEYATIEALKTEMRKNSDQFKGKQWTLIDVKPVLKIDVEQTFKVMEVK